MGKKERRRTCSGDDDRKGGAAWNRHDCCQSLQLAMQSGTVHLENAEMEQNFQNTMEDDDKYLKLFWWAKTVCPYSYVTNAKEGGGGPVERSQ